MEKIILGIDPGTNIMGYGLLKVVDGKAQMITMGVIDLRKFADGYLKQVSLTVICPTRWLSRLLSSGRMCSRC